MCVGVCVHVWCVHVCRPNVDIRCLPLCVGVCVCVSLCVLTRRPNIDIRYLPQSLCTSHIDAGSVP